jgi:glycerol-3-phosphate O-acyltransferase
MNKEDSVSMDNFITIAKKSTLSEKYINIIIQFYEHYMKALKKDNLDTAICLDLFKTLLMLIEKQIKSPHIFHHFHEKTTSPFNYYQFGLNFLRPLIDFKNSYFLGKEHISTMLFYLKNNENVILFANHQTESDPQAINLLLENDYSNLAENIIFVAGQRVLSDPLAVPFSLGCNLLCIYSKKHMHSDTVEEKHKQQLHNQKTMQRMRELLSIGGKIIYVAPSGGRDRMNEHGMVEVAPFDPQSIEMFSIMARKAQRPTHFFPLSLATYHLLPPPKKTEKEMGEERTTQRSYIRLAFGPEIDLKLFASITDKDKKRQAQADYIYKEVVKNYKKITES